MRNKYKGEDVKSRLGGTIIRYKGIPYKCEVHENGRMSLFSLEGHGVVVKEISPDDDNIDISSLTLGYINVDNPDFRLAVYLKREATRQYRQGIDVGRLTQSVLRDGVPGVPPKLLESVGLVNCVLNKYPNYAEAAALITKKSYYSVALSRDVAVKREADKLKVYVKELEVGYMRLGSNVVHVPITDMSCYSVFFLDQIKDWTISEGNK